MSYFQVDFHLNWHWVVKRSFGWLSKYRHVAGHDYEPTPRVDEAIIKAGFCHLVLGRLAKGPPPKPSDWFFLLPLRSAG